MVRAANRDKAATSIATFVLDNDLDGVDIDWEYPAAPDIPGIPAGQLDEGDNFVEFISLLKGKLAGKSLSIALPSSYWYLKNIPVKRLMAHVDYAVYMTYDYHGLWEYGNPHAQSGCPAGNCLRSHVNLTETLDSLSMLTKAGVESHKVVVGVTSYGRGFRMSSPGCTDASCTWDNSGEQLRGKCTVEDGILAVAEIDRLLTGSTTSFYDNLSDSKIAIINETWWLAYLDEDIKSRRSERYARLNFGGTADCVLSQPSSIIKTTLSPASTRSPPLNTEPSRAPPSPGDTGYSFCLNQPNVQRNTDVARASFLLGGKMASMYVADEASTFRCDEVTFPADKYFVAVWTQFSESLQGSSQPAPINCGDRIEFTNPVNGRRASGLVIDRCASCVGVGRSPADPTIGLQLVNGATVDLSVELWQYLYQGEAGAVYDIEYEGPIYMGWSEEPDKLGPGDLERCGGSTRR
ncbi:putative glycosyl hydrolases family 18 protein 6 [Elsinoe fawcettii]|nr:putative glycosyl hydrolases family 18 protein 6 [Elsinoe fawcettii]